MSIELFGAFPKKPINPELDDQDVFLFDIGQDPNLSNPTTNVSASAATNVLGIDDFRELRSDALTPTRTSSTEPGSSGQGAVSSNIVDTFSELDMSAGAGNPGDMSEIDAGIDSPETATNVQKAQGEKTSAKGQNGTQHPGLTSTKNVFIEPRPNQLSDFASFTYNIELFMLSPKRYVQCLHVPMQISTILANFAVPIIRTGGIGTDGGENFDVDFYIDNVKLTNIAAAPSSRSVNTNAIDISFDITEPNGVTLLERLKNAAKNAMTSKDALDLNS